MGTIEVILFFLGSFSGFLAGLLGIGGAIVLIPLLMYIPPLVGVTFSFHTITGLSMTQVFFSALTGAITHFKGGNLRKNLIIVVGGAMLAGSLIGSVASKFMDGRALQIVFASVLAISIYMLIKPKSETDVSVGKTKVAVGNGAACDVGYNHNEQPEYMISINEKILGASLGGAAGVLSGMAGVGGAAMLIPALSYFLRIPIKICIGTSLGIILAGGTAGFIGKAATGQVPFVPALFLVIGAIAGARIGSKVSMKLKSQQLRKILAVVLIITLIRIVITIVTTV